MHTLAEELLSNPVIEDYRMRVLPDGAAVEEAS
jgi:phosphoribosylformylglycinamidine (FGAM) synthase PurS component